MSAREPVVVITFCGALVLSLGGLATFPAVLPIVREEWGLSHTAAGWITGSYHGGYMVLVPLLAALSDRVDTKRILAASAAVAALASSAFALFAGGFWGALACQVAAGAALAGVYMPGLKGLADRIGGPRQGRYISFYTASFTVGTSLSFVVAGLAARWWGWRSAFAAAAVEQLGALLLISTAVRKAGSFAEGTARTRVPGRGRARVALPLVARVRGRFSPVLRSTQAMDYIWGYAAHMWELFALRAWLVPFLAFSLGRQPGAAATWNAPAVAAFITILGVPASIAGQEAASRIGPRRLVTGVMAAAVVLGLAAGWTASSPFWLVVLACSAYSVAISADSAPLTAAAIAAAPTGHRGATMAVHSALGFTAATLGTLAVGAALDALGGDTAPAWTAAFAVMAASGLGGIWRLRQRPA